MQISEFATIEKEKAENKEEQKQEQQQEIDEKKQEVNHKNEATTVIISTTNLHNHKSSSHRYRSTEIELTVEDVWSNDILFVAGGVIIVLMESIRVSGMVALHNDPVALMINVISSILLECASRNNLYWEIIFKCCLKRDNPPLTRFYSSMLGTRFQVEYIPYFVIVMMNVIVFGPTDSCKSDYLEKQYLYHLNNFGGCILYYFYQKFLVIYLQILLKEGEGNVKFLVI